VLGPTGAIQVEEIPDPRFDAKPDYGYVDGARWRGRPAHKDLLPEGKSELTLIEPTVVVADCELKRVEQLRPLLEIAPALPSRPPLLLVARDISGDALTMLAVNDRRGLLVSAPVVLTTARTRMADDLADIALLTGADVLSEQAGTPPERVRESQLGSARRVLIQRGYLTIRGGGGDRAVATDRAARLRTRAWELTDVRDRDRLWLRQARLAGRVAALRVRAQTEQLLEARKTQARKAIRLAGAALREGVVPGGGVAYVDCVPAVRAARGQCATQDEAAGFDAVCAGLEAPFLHLVGNAGGLEPRTALAKARELGPGHGVDVRTNTFADMVKAGVRDVTTVATAALRAAGETAGMLVSAEVVSGRG
jgi:chaperonin GroEL